MDTLIWVVVPNGRMAGANALDANIVIMPRLDSPSLAAAGMASWPPTELASAQAWVDIADADGTALPPIAATVSASAEAGLWERYFPADTPIVLGDDGAEEERAFIVHPLGDDAAAAEQIFREAVDAPLAAEGQRHAAFAAAAAASLARNQLGPPPAQPRARRIAPSPARAGAPEFHDTLGLLREHPTVQRALGLILAVRIPLPATPLPQAGFIKVRWEGAPQGIPAILSPRTAYELSDARFLPASTASIHAGMVPIGNAAVGNAAEGARIAEDAPRWHVLTVDVGSAPGIIRDAAARSAARLADAREAGAPLPALRTGGISIARAGLQADIDARHAGLRANRAVTTDTVLFADDLLLGYRLDVQRDGDSWRSLNLRDATYKVDEVPLAIGAVHEEGHIKAGAALDHGDGRLVTDDIVARWTGWSVAIKRYSYLVEPADDGPAPGRLTWQFDPVAGALPRLRFGARYRLRLRAADIAGGGLAADDPLAEREATAIIPFGRYEPIASPQLLSPAEGTYLPGESDAVIVLRSDRGFTPAEFLAANPAYAGKPARNLTPPLSSIEMAEQHQMLDELSPDQVWPIVAPVLTGADPASRLALVDPAAGGVAAFVAGMPASVTKAWQAWPAASPKRIVAQGRSDPLQPQISWRDDDLAVSLAQAATTTIEISSTLRQNLEGHMAAQIFAADGGAAGVAAAREGRNPLVTPSVAVTVTHAVRKPLRDPVGTFTAARGRGETGATLTPTTGLLGIDPESTAVLEISADWSEPDDATTVQVADRMIKAVTIDRGAVDLPETLRHEFEDTRHRAVRYTAKAISRFRHCFFDTEPDELFAVSLQTGVVNIPNSGTPPVIKILRTFPSFVWTIDTPAAPEAIVHRRDALIRVELERPWFLTGAGEELAVIIAPGGAPSAVIADHVSEIGRDPIWQTGTPSRWPSAEQFSLATGPAVQVTSPDLGEPVVAVPHAVAFDPARGCWYCDIAIEGAGEASYAPLVRLALARYQPVSLDGQSISRVMRTDFVPLLPSRTLTIDRTSPSAVTATLGGSGPAGNKASNVEYVLESAPIGVPAFGASVIAAGVDLPLLWRPVNADPVSAKLGAAARVPLPSTSGQLRLRVSELEPLVGSAQARSADLLTRRVVYADLVALA